MAPYLGKGCAVYRQLATVMFVGVGKLLIAYNIFSNGNTLFIVQQTVDLPNRNFFSLTIIPFRIR